MARDGVADRDTPLTAFPRAELRGIDGNRRTSEESHGSLVVERRAAASAAPSKRNSDARQTRVPVVPHMGSVVPSRLRGQTAKKVQLGSRMRM